MHREITFEAYCRFVNAIRGHETDPLSLYQMYRDGTSAYDAARAPFYRVTFTTSLGPATTVRIREV